MSMMVEIKSLLYLISPCLRHDIELFVMKDVVGGEFPGDFRNDFIDFGWDKFDDETKFVKRSIELNQGRAAMSVSNLACVFCL